MDKVQDRVQHCAAYLASSGGGVKSYIDALIESLPDMYASNIVSSLQNVDQSQYSLLHVHEGEMLHHLKNQCPAIYTLHNHHPYCPSGSKYFPQRQQVCDRQMSVLGCTWGHLVDRCGSVRPAKIRNNFDRAYSALKAIQKLGITVIANSDYVRSQLIANGIAPAQVITLRCGIRSPQSEHQPLSPDIHQNQRLLFVGRVVPEKGLEWLIRTMAQVNASVHLDVAGTGWDLERVQSITEALQLQNRITWHGWCDGAKLEHLYRQSFAVAFPSVWPEPAGLVTMEAYARFRPIITTAVGGIPEHIRDRQTGILVTPHRSDQLAAAINQLAENFEQAQAIGIAGNALFHQEFTMSVHAARLRSIYDAAIAKFQET